MKVILHEAPTEADWQEVLGRALVTVGKEATAPPTDLWRRRILEARHSPIRRLHFSFLLEDVPYWVSVHLVRHIHAQPYVRSQRRQQNRGEATQDAPVTMIWDMNAEELLTIANKRLCCKAAIQTRAVVEEMCRLVIERCPEFEGLLVPMCEYHGGVCHEMQPCGKNGGKTMNRGKLTVYLKDNNNYDSRYQRVWCDEDEIKLSFSVSDLSECPEDAIIGRDLFDAYDYIGAVKLGMKIAAMGYTEINVQQVDGDD